MFNFAGVACMEVLSNSDPMLYSVALFLFFIISLHISFAFGTFAGIKKIILALTSNSFK